MKRSPAAMPRTPDRTLLEERDWIAGADRAFHDDRRPDAIRDGLEEEMSILTVNLVFSTLVFWIAARIYVLPRLHELSPRSVLLPVLLLHALRHLGLMFLAPGGSYPRLPPEFSHPAAYGDLVTAVLALVAIPAVATSAGIAKPLVWVFNVWGSLDLAAAITLATIYDAAPYMGPAYWIPAFWVPTLLVTHYVTFLVLLRHWPPMHSQPT